MSTPRTGHDDVRNHTEQQTPPGLFRKGASSCPTSPLQYALKPDRTADFAAVRHLAESYGVDLLPLEMGFTPLKTQAVAKPAQRLSTADSTADHPNTPEVNDSTAAAGARDLEQAFSAANKTPRDLELETNTANDAHDSLQGLSMGAAAGTAGTSAQGAALLLQEANSGLSYPIDVDGSGSEVHTDSPSGLAAFEEGSDGYCLYLDEERLPVEERVTQLEEERDTLVDRLLATTAALHESEARYRQTEASNSQVQALLEQLQELLRRAEVERDRAKLQLKRHRVSNSQFMFPASSPDPLTAAHAEPAFVLGPAGEAAAGSTLPGLAAGLLARPASKKYKVSAGGSSSASGTRTASRDLFSSGSSADKAPATTAQATADFADATPAADRCSSGEGSTGASATAGPAAAGDSLAAADAGAGSSVVAVGLGAWGSQRSSQDSSCSSSDAVSPTACPEPVITLTPSTDEARPPVSSVVRGFEALLHRQRSGMGSSSPGQGSSGGRSRELGLTGRASSGNGSRSASPMASRGGGDRPFAPAAAPAAEAEADLPAVAAPLGLAAAAAPAAAAADAAVPASPAAGPADVDSETAAAGDVPSEDGGSSLSSEAHRRTYADAAVAGAQAERMRHRSGAGQRQHTPARTPGASSSVGSGSAVSTPTAAALCNTPPLGSHMLDSSCFSEEEESLSSWGGASLSAGGAQHPRSRPASSRGGGVYHPPAHVPGKPASAGGKAGLLPGAKRDRSSSPAASPTSVQGQGSMQQDVVSPSISQGSPGSAFGSLFSFEPGSPSGSVTQGPVSSPGAASTAGNASSSKGKQRPASRLGVTSSPGAAAPVELNPAGVPRSASSSKQEKGPSASDKQRKGQSEQQGSKARESKSNGGASTRASGGGSKQKGHGQSRGTPAVAAVPAVPPKASSPAASTGNKQCSKKAAGASQVQHSTGTTTGVSTSNAARGRMQPLLLLLLAVLVVVLVCGAAAHLWFAYQAKLTALQEQLQQLQKELTDRAMQCSSDLSQPTGPGSNV